MPIILLRPWAINVKATVKLPSIRKFTDIWQKPTKAFAIALYSFSLSYKKTDTNAYFHSCERFQLFHFIIIYAIQISIDVTIVLTITCHFENKTNQNHFGTSNLKRITETHCAWFLKNKPPLILKWQNNPPRSTTVLLVPVWGKLKNLFFFVLSFFHSNLRSSTSVFFRP